MRMLVWPFAMVTSQGASHRGGEELWVPKKYRASLLPRLASRQLSNCAPLITTCVLVLFTWCQSWGAQTQAGGCVFIRDISHQGSLLRVAHGFLLSRRPAKSHDLIRDKISSFVCVPRIWRDGAAGTLVSCFLCLGNWYSREGFIGPTVSFLY